MLKILHRNSLSTITALCLSVFLLQGCGNKVDCNSSKSKADAIEVIQSNIVGTGWYREFAAAVSGSPELTNIKTLAHNDELKQSECSAIYTYTYNGKPREIPDVVYDLAYLQDKGDVEVKASVDRVSNGMLAIEGAERPIKNGEEKVIDPKTGNLQYKLQWKNGVPDGVEEIYNPVTNKLIGRYHADNGKKVGSDKIWSADGSVLLADLDWVDGKPNGFQKQFDSTGQKLITDLTFKDGKATGVETTITAPDNYEEYHYKDGMQDGAHKIYHNRQLKPYGAYLVLEENFKDGKRDGLAQEFDESGAVASAKTYKDGVEVPVDSPQPANAPSAAPAPAQ